MLPAEEINHIDEIVNTAEAPKADHEALAQHYEVAADMQAKAEERKKLLDRYQTKSYVYGKQAETLKMHCQTLISAYKSAADANRAMAQAHRELAK